MHGGSPEYQVKVAVFVPVWSEFDYLWPDTLGVPEEGVRVFVPFGNGKRLAIVTQISKRIFDINSEQQLKTVIDRLDVAACFNSHYQHWLQRAMAYYLCSKGEMYELVLAWAATDRFRRYKRCVDSYPEYGAFKLVEAFQTKRTVSLTTIARHCGIEAIYWRVQCAVKAGYIKEVFDEKDVGSAAGNTSRISLRPSQQKAVDALMANVDSFYPLLLFGRTGSGKTEVYLQAAERLMDEYSVAEGKQVLILVPEIGLTPMWMKRLASRFEKVVIWHSGLSAKEKINARHRLTDAQVLLGTRSALFLPLERLGMIVVDEEHDLSFKQQDGVRYSARDLSLLLAQELKIPVVLGSATPSLESWRQVQAGQMHCFKLTERVHQHTAIIPEIVDMRGSSAVLSDMLLQRLKDTFARGEQAMLYLNRRGYAPALQCTSCGHVPTCRHCSVRLTLHRREGLLRCHTCDYAVRTAKTCESCGEQSYLPIGSGTERIEDELRKAIPDLRLVRFDRDAIRSASDLEDVLSRFENGEIDCLIGTQMLVKGHHFPNVTLVGVLNADLGMNLPDFRASERWWQQMTQVFGRTGRGEKAGKVVVQTWSPDAPWFTKLDEAQAEQVINEEIQVREATRFPPFSRWVRITFSAVKPEKAIQAAHHFAQYLQDWDEVKVTGPLPCAMEKQAGRFRFEIILHDVSRKHLPWKLQPLLQQLRVPSGVRRKVDVDPHDLM